MLGDAVSSLAPSHGPEKAQRHGDNLCSFSTNLLWTKLSYFCSFHFRFFFFPPLEQQFRNEPVIENQTDSFRSFEGSGSRLSKWWTFWARDNTSTRKLCAMRWPRGLQIASAELKFFCFCRTTWFFWKSEETEGVRDWGEGCRSHWSVCVLHQDRPYQSHHPWEHPPGKEESRVLPRLSRITEVLQETVIPVETTIVFIK